MNWRRLMIATVAGVVLGVGPVLVWVRRPNGYEVIVIALCILAGIMVGLAPLVVILAVREGRARRRADAARSAIPDPAGADVPAGRDA